MGEVKGDVIGGSMAGADLLIYGVLFAGTLLVCVLGALAVRAAWLRWGRPSPETPEPSSDEKARLAVYRLEKAGVDLPAVLGDWSPTRLTEPGRTASRAPGVRSPVRAG